MAELYWEQVPEGKLPHLKLSQVREIEMVRRETRISKDLTFIIYKEYLMEMAETRKFYRVNGEFIYRVKELF